MHSFFRERPAAARIAFLLAVFGALSAAALAEMGTGLVSGAVYDAVDAMVAALSPE